MKLEEELLACVRQERLHRSFDPFILQEILWILVLEEDLHHCLGFVAVPCVGVPRDGKLQNCLWGKKHKKDTLAMRAR